MADRAEVFEHNQTAFVVDQHLKVMLEEDYLALTHHSPVRTHTLASQVVKQVILPELEKEVNTGKNFANLRQIFNSIILSSWYKRNLKEALLNQVYADQSKVKGIERLSGKNLSPQEIYEQYLKAYKKGVFNYVKEDINAAGEQIPRKYFSGGIDEAMAANPEITNDAAALAKSLPAEGRLVDLTTVTDAAMAGKVPQNIYVLQGAYSGVISFLEAHVVFPITRVLRRKWGLVTIEDNGAAQGEIVIKRQAPEKYFIQIGELPGPINVHSKFLVNGSFNFRMKNGKFILDSRGPIGFMSVSFEYENKNLLIRPLQEGKEVEVSKGNVIKRDFKVNYSGHREFDVSNGEQIKLRFAGQTMSLSNRDGSLFLQEPFELGSSYFMVFENSTGKIFQISGHSADVVSIRDLSQGKKERQSQVLYNSLIKGQTPEMIKKALGRVILDKLIQGLSPNEIAEEIDYKVLLLESVKDTSIKFIGTVFYKNKELAVGEAIDEINQKPDKKGYVLFQGKQAFLILQDKAMTAVPHEINLRNIIEILGQGGETKQKVVDLLEKNALTKDTAQRRFLVDNTRGVLTDPLQQVYNITRQRVIESGAVFFDGHEIPQAVIKLLPDVLKALNSGHDVKIEVVKRGRYGKNAWPSELAVVDTNEKLILNTPYSISGLLLLASINGERFARDEISFILRHPDDNLIAARLRFEKDRIEQLYENGRKEYFDRVIRRKLDEFFRKDNLGRILPPEMRNLYIQAFFKNRKLTTGQKRLLADIPGNYDRLVELAVKFTRDDFIKPQALDEVLANLLTIYQFLLKKENYQVQYKSPTGISFIMNDLQGALESPTPVYWYAGYRLAGRERIAVVPDKAMIGLQDDQKGIMMESDDIVSWERVSRLAGREIPQGILQGQLQGKITQISLPAVESFEKYLADQNVTVITTGLPGQVKQYEIGLWWNEAIGRQTVKKMIVVRRNVFTHIILNVLRENSYFARLLMADLDESLTDAQIGQAAMARLDQIEGKWLNPRYRQLISGLGKEEYFIDYDALPRVYINSEFQNFIDLYLSITTRKRAFEFRRGLEKFTEGDIRLLLSRGYENTNSLRTVEFQPGFLKSMIADLYDLDPQTAASFVNALMKQSRKRQVNRLSRAMSNSTVKELDIISRWLDEHQGSIELPAELGSAMQRSFEEQNIRLFHHYPNGLPGNSRLIYPDGVGGNWGFIGNRNIFFIMLGNLDLKNNIIFKELIGALTEEYPELLNRLLAYYASNNPAAVQNEEPRTIVPEFSTDAQISKLKENLDQNHIHWTLKVPQNETNMLKARQSIDVTSQVLDELEKALDAHESFKAEKVRIERAIELLFDKQGQNLRPDASFYPSHALRAALGLINTYGITDPKFIIASLLHDFIEDVDEYSLSPKLLGENFGPDVQALVESVTNKELTPATKAWLTKNIFKPAGVTPEADRPAFDAVMKIIEFQLGVTGRITSDPNALLLKSVDFSDNAGIKRGDLEDNPELQSRFVAKYRGLIPIFSQALFMMAKKEEYNTVSPNAVLIAGLKRTAWNYRKRYEKVAAPSRLWQYDGQLTKVVNEINQHYGGLWGLSQRLQKGDLAMTAPGGIDLNTSYGMRWKISKDGRGVEMNIDPAMLARIRQEGIDSLTPVILRMSPVSSVWTLAGLNVIISKN